MFLKKTLAFTFLLPCLFFNALPLGRAAVYEKTAVVTSEPLATQAALEVLKAGGNAVDAAVAAQWILSVVQPHACGPGGSAQFLFYDAAMRRVLFFDGNIRAPGKASRGMFLDEKGELPDYTPDRNTGGFSVGVPGWLLLLEEVHAEFGTRKFSFARLLDPAVRQAAEGIEVSESLARALRRHLSRLKLTKAFSEDFQKNGQPLAEGQKWKQPALAKAYRMIQEKGSRQAFYEGAIGKAMVRAVQKCPFYPGLINFRDLESYKVVRRNPVHGTYQGYDLFSFSAPSAGGILTLEALNVLAQFDVPGLAKSPDIFHLLQETQKITFSNCSAVADPDFYEIPEAALLAPQRGQALAGKIKFEKTYKPEKTKDTFADPVQDPVRASVLVADDKGNLVIVISSLGDALGAAVRVPEFGFFLNNQMTDFDSTPEIVRDPEAANGIAPGQRPRNREAPFFVFDQGRPRLMAAAYGPEEPAGVLLNLLTLSLGIGTSCKEAIEAPRVLNVQGVMKMEPPLFRDGLLRTRLELLGQRLEEKEALGLADMICFESNSGKISVETDPRGSGEAAGF